MRNLVFATILFLAFSSCSEPVEKLQPNIVFVLTDDQGYGDLACHGNPWIQTPHLDQLHDESVTFTNFHVGTTCAPSRSGLMSGNNCNRVGAWHTIMGKSMLSTRFKALPQYLKDAGYATGIFGKWHLGDAYPYRPQDRGFEEVLIHGGGGVGQTPDYWNNDYFDDTYFHNGTPQKYEGYCTDIWFEEAMKFMEDQQAKDKPFFTYIATNAPHGPYHVPKKYIDMYAENDSIPNPNFYGMITNADENIGRLRAFLDEKDLLENTIFIFMTDNGTSSGVKFGKGGEVLKGYNAGMRATKGSEYEGGHRVPMFMRFPEQMGIAKTAFSELVSYVDFMPTLLDILAVSPDEGQRFDGTSIKPLIYNGSQDGLKKRVLVADKQRVLTPVKWKNASVMQEHWRLVNNKELYDLNTDPGQKQNIISQHPEKANELEKAYEKWWESLQEDLKKENLLYVGAKEENPVLLTAHDWHSEELPPWNQNHIRSDFEGNGYWLINVVERGDYRIRLYRWPPSTNQAINTDMPQGDAIDGGKPYAIGKGFEFTQARLQVGEQALRKEEIVNPAYYEFDIFLVKGRHQLQTWLKDAKDFERGAFYVEVYLNQ